MDDGLNRHERRMLKREQKQQERSQQETQEKRQSRKKNLLGAGVALVLIIIGGYAVTSLPAAPGPAPEFDLSGIPNSFVHWHADVDVVVCGEEHEFPEALPGGSIGVPSMHTHDQTVNIQSLPGSDGNGVIHNEAVIPQQPAEQTLGKFLDLMGVPFSQGTVLDKQDGDTCPDGTAGTVTFRVNGQPNDQWRNYIPRDGDVIVIAFAGAA
ncbi:MAG: hypothetical protein HY369_03920 [Candidatus Aenigmarchaeota archaeon]|nr:hypothetical protein [Candidatus Aenigmarchaeota archaeon]